MVMFQRLHENGERWKRYLVEHAVGEHGLLVEHLNGESRAGVGVDGELNLGEGAPADGPAHLVAAHPLLPPARARARHYSSLLLVRHLVLLAPRWWPVGLGSGSRSPARPWPTDVTFGDAGDGEVASCDCVTSMIMRGDNCLLSRAERQNSLYIPVYITVQGRRPLPRPTAASVARCSLFLP
jgi:hypothetical protein